MLLSKDLRRFLTRCLLFIFSIHLDKLRDNQLFNAVALFLTTTESQVAVGLVRYMIKVHISGSQP